MLAAAVAWDAARAQAMDGPPAISWLTTSPYVTGTAITTPDPILGFMIPGANRIYVRAGLARGVLIRTVAHETAHAWQASVGADDHFTIPHLEHDAETWARAFARNWREN